MKNFNFQKYQSLLRYSMVENRKTYLSAFGISLLVFALFFMLIGHCFAYDFGTADLTGTTVQGAIDISSLLGTYVFFVVMMFVVTQVEVANRYCIAREGTQYCLLPATYKEKGFAILTQFAIFQLIAPIVFYLIIYSFLSLYYAIYGCEFTFQPFACIEHFGDLFNINQLAADPRKLPVANTLRLLLWLLPVSWAVNLLYYLVLVTFFRTKAQLKAYGLQIVISNVLTWLFMGCVTFITTLYETSDSFHAWFENTFNTPATIAHIIDTFILLQIPIALLFGWWFFRRLRYKEIK